MLTQPPRVTCTSSRAKPPATQGFQRVAAALTGRCGRSRADSQVISANTDKPNTRCAVTTAGISLCVTVHAPNAPCTHTATRVVTASAGERPSSRR
ncbi:hypothetical protein D3C72_1796930 [compost metagenome]